MNDAHQHRGPIAWMAKNRVAANLLMSFLIVGGLFSGLSIKQEVFPEFDLDIVQIVVPYPGASPAEVEKGIVKVVEEEVRGLDGVEEVRSQASESVGTVSVELLTGTDGNKALQDVKSAVDRIVTFPENAERPRVRLLSRRREVVRLVLYGDMGERELRQFAERVRDGLQAKEGITLVELSGVRPLEIAIEIPQATLRKHDLTLQGVAAKVRRAALELPAGGVKTRRGELLLRLDERRDMGSQFENITIISAEDGTEVRLGEIATITDGFRETDQASFYNGKRAAQIEVYRTGDQTPIEVATIVKEHLKTLEGSLPEGMAFTITRDWSDIYRQRIDLLLRNAFLGLALVMVLLGLFLDVRLAFWVTMGIPASFLGALLLMPAYDVSINMISLFAFITSLGIVVDDAIVVGENIYEMRQRGLSGLQAALAGVREVAVPVTFSVLTNIVAFVPLFFVPGVSGKLFRQMPAVVVSVFTISLIECLYILPAHLSHQRQPSRLLFWRVLRAIHALPERALHWCIDHLYVPVQRLALRLRYATVAAGVAVLGATVAFAASGRLPFRFFPLVESDTVRATAVLPYGTPWAETQRLAERLKATAQELLDENPHQGKSISKGIYSRVDGHVARVWAYMVPMDQRGISATAFTSLWRHRVGDVAGLESLVFKANIGGPTGGSAIDVELSHVDMEVLERAASELAGRLTSYAGIKDIDDGFARGKPQLNYTITPEAQSLGLTAFDLGRHVRCCFYGAEALRQQRGRDEVRVMVRLPEDERTTEHSLENLILRTPRGGEILFAEAAAMRRGRAYTQIRRVNGRRTINVTADAVRGVADPGKVNLDLTANYLPTLIANHPGLSYDLAGESRERDEALAGLGRGLLVALVVIYAMLAIPFKSYIQPLIVMTSIPFGIVGAIAGHVIMGYNLSIISAFGIVALAGVVVNDSLILIHAANRRRAEGGSAFDAISYAGRRRFRPILLTSLTTFLGLMPMIFETSIQARILVPMAISLGYGILFATVIALLLVPALYLVVEDGRAIFRWLFPSRHIVPVSAAGATPDDGPPVPDAAVLPAASAGDAGPAERKERSPALPTPSR